MEQNSALMSKDIARYLLLLKRKSPVCGKQLQSLMSLNRLNSLGTACRSLLEANQAFGKVISPSKYTWNAIISANACHGENAFDLYHSMQQSCMTNKTFVYIVILKACMSKAAFPEGRLIHNQIKETGFESDIAVVNTLIGMYAKCGRLREAQETFQRLQDRNVVSWGAMIAAYAQLGYSASALKLFGEMQEEGIKPRRVTFLSILKACSSSGAIEQGRLVHEQIIANALGDDVTLGNSLVNMYAKCGSLDEAGKEFDQLQCRDVVSWGAMITGCVQHGHGMRALQFFQKMQQEGIKPDLVIFLSSLKACGSLGAIQQGRLIHEKITNYGLQWDRVIGNTLIDMYAKCRSLYEAHKLFEELPSQDSVSWAALIAGYAQNGYGIPALNLFEFMQHEGIKAERAAVLSALKACCHIGALERGRLIHDQIIKGGSEQDLAVGSALIDMYAKCGCVEAAHKVFCRLSTKNVISWTAIISGYAQTGDVRLAMQYFEDMQRQGIWPSDVTFTSILTACGQAGLLDEGCQFFKIMRQDYDIEPDIYHYNCMTDLLGRAGRLVEADDFVQAVRLTTIGWISLLTACRTYGNVDIGKQCFELLVQADPCHAAAYILMADIYIDAHMWKDATRIEDLRKCAGAWKKPAKAWIEVDNTVHEFIVGASTHERNDEIYAMLKKISKQMKEQGYIRHASLLSSQLSEERLDDVFCGHCEKLAIAFGLLSTPEGTLIRATKNLRVCADCHSAMKIISKIERREIIIKDRYRIHYFKEGLCSCEDYN